MDPVKVAGVMEWHTPSNRKEVQSFLGFTNFYCRFIQGFSHLARPLFDLTQKDTEWRCGAEEQSAFNALKKQITTAPILALLDNSQPFRIKADSLDFTTGGVLSQQSPEDNKWHPVVFLSKSISPVERNYKIHDKEMLAIVTTSNNSDFTVVIVTVGSASGSLKAEPKECLTGKGQVLSKGLRAERISRWLTSILLLIKIV